MNIKKKKNRTNKSINSNAYFARFHPNLDTNEERLGRARAFSMRYFFRFAKPSAFVIPSAFVGLSVHAAPVSSVRRCASPVAFLFSDPLDSFIGILLPTRFGPRPSVMCPAPAKPYRRRLTALPVGTRLPSARFPTTFPTDNIRPRRTARRTRSPAPRSDERTPDTDESSPCRFPPRPRT